MDDDGFRAKVRQVYRLQDTHLLVLEEDYRGDVGPGDRLEIALPSGASARTSVRDLAWGSAFHAQNPPLTLIVDLVEAEEPEAGAVVRIAS
ncbi:MAG TPA: hypothetical protein RMH99_13235 [Sandaracinaceae bacterium LLY-WYZ-13_1]|nr:hypothetical protein [Sandaracinaceae bacterium LLY-WYZ-13_1]